MQLKAVIVGCGRVSRFHAQAYQHLDNVRLLAGVDINPEKRKSFTEKFKVPTFRSVKELLSKMEVNLVSVCTPSNLHAKMACELMREGVNVLIEKPVCLSEDEANMLMETKKKTGVVVATCFQNRFNLPVIWLKKMIERKKLGKIFFCQICVRWYRDQKYFQDEWHGSKQKSGGGVLMTQSIHHVDLLRCFIGNPDKIIGYTMNSRNFAEVEDIVIANMTTKIGTLIGLECSTVAYSSDFEASISVLAENGTIKIGGKSLNRIEYGCIKGEKVPTGLNSKDPINVYGTSHILLIKDVIKAIQKKEDVSVSLEEGIKTWRLVKQIYSSLESFE